MDIKDIEVLIECKRLVEIMLSEKKYALSRLEGNGNERAQNVVIKQIARMERALEGKPHIQFYTNLGR